ncbi:MAG: SidJ-related pseudokinase [Desulfosarcinaceae bacterium]
MSALEARLRDRALEVLSDKPSDFQAILFALQDLYDLAGRNPDEICGRTLASLRALLLSRHSDRQRQRLFVFRHAASILSQLIAGARRTPAGRGAWEAIREVLGKGRDLALRAAAESLGILPAAVTPATPPALPPLTGPALSWHKLLASAGFGAAAEVAVKGRTLVVGKAGTSTVLAVKFARDKSEGPGLQCEAGWMAHLNENPPQNVMRCDIPQPLARRQGWVVSVRDAPFKTAGAAGGGGRGLAIAYLVSSDYFRYPNPADPTLLPSPAGFAEIMQRNAFLLGCFAAGGLGHQAPIPLFHNRVQQERRRDGGLYEWFRAGRLDRWLASCAYPNFGVSGIRDFEHLVPVGGSGGDLQLYRMIGQHLLSLLLVAGSYFRVREPQRRGLDVCGRPVDARDLFDPALLQAWIEMVFKGYHHGFVGGGPDTALPVDTGALALRMVEEMGVDRHMEEILRTADQNQMSPAQFRTFLLERGYPPDALAGVVRGRDDLVLPTGPHLGEFNRGISLPEIIEAVAAIAALCIAGRFRRYH